jgi:hypothetical protein
MTDKKDPRRGGNIGGEPHRIKNKSQSAATGSLHAFFAGA